MWQLKNQKNIPVLFAKENEKIVIKRKLCIAESGI